MRRNSVKNLNNNPHKRRRSFCQLSVPLFFWLWCSVILFQTKFGLTRGNEVEQMLEDLITNSGEASANRFPNPNSTAIPSILPEKITNAEINVVGKNVSAKVESLHEVEKLSSNVEKKPVAISSNIDPFVKTKQPSTNRLHADAAIKVVLQKVRSLELNLAFLEDYIKEINRRQMEVVPELQKDLAKFHVLLEKNKLELKNLIEWKESVDEGTVDLASWRTSVSTQIELLVRENSVMRIQVDKVYQVLISNRVIVQDMDFDYHLLLFHNAHSIDLRLIHFQSLLSL